MFSKNKMEIKKGEYNLFALLRRFSSRTFRYGYLVTT